MNPYEKLHLALNINADAVAQAQKRANLMYHRTVAGDDSHDEAMSAAGEILARAITTLVDSD